ncbi:hypothetical protein ONZ43_g2133 [Nemania bipapillata]|uniref:Uncharacterized protein n=1 Tax=Nemania bipapillata TaxID=110536 RepID=A0ACC2J234_9PEZI|nr:hypothetical protein ONZ43_g2133 [Nemania bipapillata]
MTLIEHRADLNAASTSDQVNLRGHTPLHRAALRTNPASVQLLAAKGASVNAITANGITAQHIAVQKGSLAIVLILTAFGARHTKDARGNGVAQYAEALDDTHRGQIMAILRKWGDNSIYRPDLVRFQSSGEFSRFFNGHGNLDLPAMLCWAAAKGRRCVVEYALDMSALEGSGLVNTKDQSGWAALHHAAWGGEHTIIQRLLQAGAAVNGLTTNHRWTPLLLAAEKGRRRAVQVLLEHQADILARTHRDSTALDLAAEGQHTKTLRVLIEEIRNPKFMETIKDTERRKLATIEYHKAQGIGGNDETVPESEVAMHQPLWNSGNTDLFSGAFDGTMFSTSRTHLHMVQSPTYDRLINTWNTFFEFHEKDRRVKVAILDTGFDPKHRDWENPRALRFRNNQPESDSREARQLDRIKEFRDFCGDDNKVEERDGVDVDGHGTQVTGIILRLAPRADVYVARICEGDKNRGVPPQLQAAGQITSNNGPKPAAVAANRQ